MKLDYTLQSPEERKQLVEKILEETPEPSPQYLEILADYLSLCMEKQEKKEKKLLTENRLTTIGRRETSFEGLASQFENGEDGLYNLVTEDKNILFHPKDTITEHDIETIPFLKQMREAIELWESKLKKASGRDAYIIKRAIIDLRKDQYLIKESYLKPVRPQIITRTKSYIPLDGYVEINENGECVPHGISFLDPKVCSVILCNYSKLKQDSYGNFYSDTYFLMESFDKLCDLALGGYPIYEKIVEYKIDGLTNQQIQEKIIDEFDTKYSLEYISALWRKKIPALLASAAEDQYLDYYYLNEEKGKYKKCSKCGQVKLAHNKYFSKNKTSKDGFYSICKQCRNKKKSAVGQK